MGGPEKPPDRLQLIARPFGTRADRHGPMVGEHGLAAGERPAGRQKLAPLY
jgi:hypothetical protein